MFTNLPLNNLLLLFSYILDILLLSFLIYQTYKVLYQSKSLQITNGLFFFLLTYFVSYLFNLQILLWIFKNIFSYFLIIVVILYQTEIRQLLASMNFEIFPSLKKDMGASHTSDIKQVIRAASHLSSKRKGGLICFVNWETAKDFIRGGVSLEATITSELLISIFEYETPLHDGGVLIQGNKILLAGCLLPLSHQEDLSQHFGTRHRAALGLSEETDSVIVIISEETGAISLAYGGKLDYNLDPEDLFERLNLVLSENTKKIISL